MQSVELTQIEIEIILALLMNFYSTPIRLGNKAIYPSYFDDLKPFIDKFKSVYEDKEKLL